MDQTFTTIALPPPPVLPTNRTPPAVAGVLIGGHPILGKALSVAQGTWSGTAPITFTHQWLRCDAHGNGCQAIAGATRESYVPSAGDEEHKLKVQESARNAAGASLPATSAPSATVGSHVGAAMTWEFNSKRRYTLVESLVVKKKTLDASVEISCRGGGCPFLHAHAASSHRSCHRHHCKAKPRFHTVVNLSPGFKNRRLAVGTRILVSVVKSGWIGKYFLFTIRADEQEPSEQSGCLLPGSSKRTECS